MKKTFSKFFLAPLTALILASFAMAPIAEARGGGGHGGGHGGGGHARAGGGGGGHKQVNNVKRDARTNNVRSTSVNNVNRRNTNVNVNKNVNVDVDRHGGRGGCCGGGWDNDYHPVATAVAVTAAVAVTSAVVGSIVRSVPSNCVPVNYGGMIYQQCGSTWYQPQGSQYVVINAPY
jgi:hypothetical protein